MRAVVESLGVSGDSPNPTLVVLKYYIERGIYVVPAWYGDKQPSVAWREIAQTEEGFEPEVIIGRFYQKPYPNRPDRKLLLQPGETNFAVICGKRSGGLVIVDFDDEEKGREFPLQTFTVATGKGLHYYVRITDSLIPNGSFPKSKLDLRGQGGIAIIPPSVHPTGRVYRIENDHPIADLTTAQFQVYLERVLGEGAPSYDGTGDSANPPGWFEQTLGEVCPEGARNETCTRLAGKLLSRGLTITETIAVMSLWVQACTSPPMSLTEMLASIKSVGRRHAIQAAQSAAKSKPTAEYTPGTEFGGEDDNADTDSEA